MKKLNLFNKICYGVGNFGYATISQTVSTFIMFFGTSVLGVRGVLVGIAVSLSVFWDALSDPIVGYFSDKQSCSRYGKRYKFLIVGTIGMCITNLILWAIPITASEIVKFILLLSFLLFIETFCTVFSTPYVALGYEISDDYNEQTSLQAIKTIFFLLGLMMPSILMILFMKNTPELQGQLNPQAYKNISYITTIICLTSGILLTLGCLKKNKCMVSKCLNYTFSSVIVDFFEIFKNKNFRSLILGYSVSMISSAIISAAGMHLFTYSFHFGSLQISIVMVILFGASIISQGYWLYKSKKTDKLPTLKNAINISTIGIILVGVVFFLRDLFSTDMLFWLTIPGIAICGFGTGALYSLPFSMFGDLLAIDKKMSNQDKTATYSGFMTLSYKIANAVALLIIGVSLDIIKFNQNSPVQSLKVQNELGVLVILGVLLSFVISQRIYNGYTISKKDIKINTKKEKDINESNTFRSRICNKIRGTNKKQTKSVTRN